MNSEDQPRRDPQADPAQRSRRSQGIEGAEAADDEQVEQHDPERHERDTRPRAGGSWATLTKMTFPMNWVVETSPGTM